MPAWLDPDLTTMAFCWRLARTDGVSLGFTSHDRDLWRDGLLYRATPGMVPSAVELTSSLEPDSVDLSGVLTSDAISAQDLSAGRWDGAALKLFMIDWTHPENEAVPLVRGTLGTVQMEGDSFKVELLGPSAALDAPVIEATSPGCRARLGDKRCRVDMAGRSAQAAVASAAGLIVSLNTALTPGDFAYGRLRWTEGANAGLAVALAANTAMTVTLAEPMAERISAGDRAELTQGCDRRFSTCRDRFANTLNFRGEPHLPGNDLLTRYVS